MRFRLLIIQLLIASFVLGQKPVITDFSPKSGVIGTVITISGSGFNTTAASNIVFFGATRGEVTAASATQLSVKVPKGASYANLIVTNASNGLIGSSNVGFTPSFVGGDSLMNSSIFGKKIIVDSLKASSDLFVRDFNNDAKPDLMAIVFDNTSGNTISVLQNNTDNNKFSFGARVNLKNGNSNMGGGCVVDLDGDGKLDICEVDFTVGKLRVFKNSSTDGGSISFIGGLEFGSSIIGNQLVPADIDGDGRIDILSYTKSGSDSVMCFRNTSVGGTISFAIGQKIKFNHWTAALSLADINGDLKNDLIISYQSTTYVYLNSSTSGQLKFDSTSTKLDPITAAQTESMVVYDIDRDGKNDILYSNYDSSTLYVYKNIGTGNSVGFTQVQRFNYTNPIAYPFVADLNGDGLPDFGSSFYVSNIDGRNIAAVQNKSGVSGINMTNFIVSKSIGTSYNFPARTDAVDINDDGKPDVITNDGVNEAVLIFANRSGETVLESFAPAIARSGDTVFLKGVKLSQVTSVSFGGSQASSFKIVGDSLIQALVDQGNSGNVKIVFPGGSDSLSGFSFGSLRIDSIVPSKAKPNENIRIYGANFSSVKYDNQVVFGHVSVNTIVNSSNSITVQVPLSASMSPLTVITGGRSATSKEIFVPMFDGADSTFRPVMFNSRVDNLRFANVDEITIGDVNGDRANDYLVSTGAFAGVGLVPNIQFPKSNPFGNTLRMDLAGGAGSTVIFDADNDGKPDVVALNIGLKKVALFRNQLSGSTGVINSPFPQRVDIPYSGSYRFMYSGDLDGDGRKDIILATDNDSLAILMNKSDKGSMLFNNPVYFKIPSVGGSHGGKLAVYDFDKDGKAEITYVSYESVIIVSTIFSNNQFALVSQRITISGRYLEGKPIIADFDQDGKDDIVSTDFTTKNIIVLKNNANQTNPFSFIETTALANSVNVTHLLSADFNGDGFPDIGIAARSVLPNDSTTNILLYRNLVRKGSVAFSSPLILNGFSYVSGFAAGDMDQDGRPDLLVSNLNYPNGVQTSKVIFLHNGIGDTAAIGSKPIIRSATPMNIAAKDTIQIIGSSFSKVGNVTFGAVPATYFSVVNDTLIKALAGNGRSGFLTVRSLAGADSIAGVTVTGIVSISNFSPRFALIADSVRISGTNLDSTKSVTFGGVNAKSFRIIGDTAIVAVVDSGATGIIRVSGTKGNASMDGFYFGPARIIVRDSASNASIRSFIFTNETIKVDSAKLFWVSGQGIRTNIRLQTPTKFQVSFFNSSVVLQNGAVLTATNGTVPQTPLVMKYIGPKIGGDVVDSLVLETPSGETIKLRLVFNICDSTNKFLPQISDTSLKCFKDSLRLRIINSSLKFLNYQWSTGDTTESILLNTTKDVRLRVTLKEGCFSDSSNLVRFVNHINTVPVISVNNDSILTSTLSANYRWYINNRSLSGGTTRTITAKRIGLYRVETSSNNICWDASNEVAIISLGTRSNNDTLVVRAYPNPANGGNFTVQASLRNPTNVTARLLITDMSGTNIIQNTRFIFFGREIRIPVTITTKGTYVVRVEMNGEAKTVNVIVQ